MTVWNFKMLDFDQIDLTLIQLIPRSLTPIAKHRLLYQSQLGIHSLTRQTEGQ